VGQLLVCLGSRPPQPAIRVDAGCVVILLCR
jgi:hypothetical protein